MSIIEASFVRVAGTLADGTLRLVVDVEPCNAQAAFALFNAPGTQMALAALKPAPFVPAEPTPPKEKIGALCLLAVQWCKEPKFWDYCNTTKVFLPAYDIENEGEAAELICHLCAIDSRKELDTNDAAGREFDRLFRKPYMEYLRAAA